MRRALLRACLAAAIALAIAPAAVTSADDGPPRRPPGTVLRPDEFTTERLPAARPRSTKEVVVLVSGVGSRAADPTFDKLVARLYSDPRYEVRRFGADPEHPYDALGSLDASAAQLTAEIRELGARYAGVHLVGHSMGGAVIDRAFARGLSASDGVRTYVALAVPHSGSTGARIAQPVLAAARDEALEVRGAISVVQDPGSVAVRDLAALRASAPPKGVARLDLRLATDAVVLRADDRTPGVVVRTLLPSTRAGLEGHGGVTTDPRALDLTLATIGSGRPPADDRGWALRSAAAAISALFSLAVPLMLCGVGLCALLATFYLRRVRVIRRVTRPWALRRLASLR